MKQLTSTEAMDGAGDQRVDAGIRQWVADCLATDPPRAKSLVMTIFGDAIAPHGGKVWLGSLIGLLAPFGVNDRLLRTSVFRLAQEGWLEARRHGRRSAYAIPALALRRLERANQRIYLAPGGVWDGRWTLVFGAHAVAAPIRAALRKELLWQGYGMVAPGVIGHPAGALDVVDEILARLGAQGQVVVCKAAEAPPAGGRALCELVDGNWDLASVGDGYRQFMVRFAPLLDMVEALVAAQRELAPEIAFAARTLLIHAYRRVQLHDPGLPVALLPAPWPGEQAYALARALYRHTHGGAEKHIVEVLRREEAGAVEATLLGRFAENASSQN